MIRRPISNAPSPCLLTRRGPNAFYKSPPSFNLHEQPEAPWPAKVSRVREDYTPVAGRLRTTQVESSRQLTTSRPLSLLTQGLRVLELTSSPKSFALQALTPALKILSNRASRFSGVHSPFGPSALGALLRGKVLEDDDDALRVFFGFFSVTISAVRSESESVVMGAGRLFVLRGVVSVLVMRLFSLMGGLTSEVVGSLGGVGDIFLTSASSDLLLRRGLDDTTWV